MTIATRTALTLIGLGLVFLVTRSVVWRARGFDPERAAQDSDCDQCVLTETLDALPWIAAACAAYLVAVGAGIYVAHRRAARRKVSVAAD